MNEASYAPGQEPIWLKVCITCDRRKSSERGVGSRLADALEQVQRETGQPLAAALRRVPCLSGCLHPGNIALGGGRYRWKVRLHGLAPQHAADIAVLADLYARAAAGHVPPGDWPESLRSKRAALAPPQ